MTITVLLAVVGLGQFYNRQPEKGVVVLLGLWLGLPALTWFVLGPLVPRGLLLGAALNGLWWLAGVVDALVVSFRLNHGQAGSRWGWPAAGRA